LLEGFWLVVTLMNDAMEGCHEGLGMEGSVSCCQWVFAEEGGAAEPSAVMGQSTLCVIPVEIAQLGIFETI
jgi:hypothetical protein